MRLLQRQLPVMVLLVTGALSGCTKHGTPQPVPSPTTAVSSTRVVYRLEDHSASPTRVTTELVEVAPPFRGRTLTSDGPPPGGASLGGFAWSETRLYTIDADGSAREVQAVPPGFPGPDGHLDIALPVAARLGLVRPGARATAGGRACREWISLEPLDGTPFADATLRDHTETCVSPSGVILGDRWTVNGRLARVRTAVEVGAGTDLRGAALFGGATPAPLPSGVSVQQVRLAPPQKVADALRVPLPPEPAGVTADLAAGVVELDPNSGQQISAGGVLTWTGPGRLVVFRLRLDARPGTRPPIAGARITLGRLGTGRLTPVYSGLQVQVLGPRGLLLTVVANLPEAELLSWLRGLSLG